MIFKRQDFFLDTNPAYYDFLKWKNEQNGAKKVRDYRSAIATRLESIEKQVQSITQDECDLQFFAIEIGGCCDKIRIIDQYLSGDPTSWNWEDISEAMAHLETFCITTQGVIDSATQT